MTLQWLHARTYALLAPSLPVFTIIDRFSIIQAFKLMDKYMTSVCLEWVMSDSKKLSEAVIAFYTSLGYIQSTSL